MGVVAYLLSRCVTLMHASTHLARYQLIVSVTLPSITQRPDDKSNNSICRKRQSPPSSPSEGVHLYRSTASSYRISQYSRPKNQLSMSLGVAPIPLTPPTVDAPAL